MLSESARRQMSVVTAAAPLQVCFMLYGCWHSKDQGPRAGPVYWVCRFRINFLYFGFAAHTMTCAPGLSEHVRRWAVVRVAVLVRGIKISG